MTEIAPVRVLLVEDEPTDRELVKHALDKHACQFAVTERDTIDGILNALDTIPCDVVVMDYKLKGFSGLYMIDMIRNNDFHHPIVMLTGTGTEETVVAAMKRGVTDYVIKRLANIERLPYILELVAQRYKTELDLRSMQTRVTRERDCLMDALEASPEAVSVFDRQDRLVFCNTRYKDWLFANDETFVHPDMDFETLLRRFADSNLVLQPQESTQVWLAEQIARHRNHTGSSEFRVAGGRVVRAEEYAMREGGVLAIYADITESRTPDA